MIHITESTKTCTPHRYQEIKKQIKLKTDEEAIQHQEELKSQEKYEENYNSSHHESLGVNLMSHIKQALPGGLLVVVVFFLVFFEVESWNFDDMAITIMISLILGLPLLLQAFLHVNYWLVNKNTKIEQKGYNITFKQPYKTFSFSYGDIKAIDIYLTISQFRNGRRSFPNENYTYGVIKLNNGDSHVVTSLIDEELIWLKWLKPSVTKTHSKLLCFVSLN